MKLHDGPMQQHMATPARPISTHTHTHTDADNTPADERPHLLLHVTQEQRIVEAAHHIAAHFRHLEHLAQLVQVAGDEVQEGQALVRLVLLVTELHDLQVALPQCLQPCMQCIRHTCMLP